MRTSCPWNVELAGQRLDLQKLIRISPVCEQISAPGATQYAGALLHADVRFVLSGSGHRRHRGPMARNPFIVSSRAAPTAAGRSVGLVCCGDHPSDDLVGGLGAVDQGTGEGNATPRMGSRKYRPIIDAPGTYVLER